MGKSKTKSNQPGAKRGRERALPSRDAFAWTIPDFQSLGAPGKTWLYGEDKKRRERGEKGLLFKDRTGRTMVFGDSGRELLSEEDA